MYAKLNISCYIYSFICGYGFGRIPSVQWVIAAHGGKYCMSKKSHSIKKVTL